MVTETKKEESAKVESTKEAKLEAIQKEINRLMEERERIKAGE